MHSIIQHYGILKTSSRKFRWTGGGVVSTSLESKQSTTYKAIIIAATTCYSPFIYNDSW